MTLIKTHRELIDQALSEIKTLKIDEALSLVSDPTAHFIDIREIRELEREGIIPGSFHAPRGMLEFWIDPTSPYFKTVFGLKKHFVFYCQSGWRSALSTFAVQNMGLSPVSHIEGGFRAWIEAGGPVSRLADKK
jgi:rhodanese-related sulfurtransferase